MAVAIDSSYLALDIIPEVQRLLDRAGAWRRWEKFHIHRISAYATILPLEIWRQLYSVFDCAIHSDDWLATPKALNWQAGPDDDLGDAAVLHHLHQQAATVPVLSSDPGNAATTVTGSALSASINARTQGRRLSSFHRQSFQSILRKK